MYRYLIYIRTNLISGKSYIGYTTESLEKRWDKGKGYGSAMGAAVKEYGPSSWVHEELAYSETEEDALHVESELIQEYGTLAPRGYNILPHGKTNPVHTEIGLRNLVESRRKVGYTEKQKRANEAKRGKPTPWMLGDSNPMRNPEIAAKMGATNRGRELPTTKGDKHHMRKNPDRARAHGEKIRGRVTVNNGSRSVCVHLQQAETLIAEGWTRGLLRREACPA